MTLLTPNFAQLHAAKTNGALPPAQLPVPAAAAVNPETSPAQSWIGSKVAIIGTAPSSRMMAPYSDPTWKIWGCSPGNQNILPKVDCWFELHANLFWPECESYGRPYIKWLSEQKWPVFLQADTYQDQIPRAWIFPKDQLIAEFGPYFFTSSFAWMTAFAIMAGCKEVAMYGIDMASRDEYILQRAGGQYFIVEGARRGVKVWAPHESDIMQPPGLYGYSDKGPLGRKTLARESELKQRVNQIDQQLATLQRDSTYLKGALEDVDYFKSIHIGAQDNNTASTFLDGLRQKFEMAAALAVPQPTAPPSSLSPPLTAAVAPTKRKPGRPRKRPMPSAETHSAGQG
jgi:hypothetical protein